MASRAMMMLAIVSSEEQSPSAEVRYGCLVELAFEAGIAIGGLDVRARLGGRGLSCYEAADCVDLLGCCDLEFERAVCLVGGRVHLAELLGEQRDLADEAAAGPRPLGGEQQLRGVACGGAGVPAAMIAARPADGRCGCQ